MKNQPWPMAKPAKAMIASARTPMAEPISRLRRAVSFFSLNSGAFSRVIAKAPFKWPQNTLAFTSPLDTEAGCEVPAKAGSVELSLAPAKCSGKILELRRSVEQVNGDDIEAHWNCRALVGGKAA